MTTRNFDALFQPKAIALIGASNRVRSVGSVLMKNLMSGGFSGPIWPVNPHEARIGSVQNFRSIDALPEKVDLAIVATPPATVPRIISELGARGCRAAVVISAGFGEGGHAEGISLRQELLAASAPHLLRIVGPNCLGFISPATGINASFSHLQPAPGHIAFVTQSGAIATSVIDWAQGRGIGFSHIVSVGDMADIDFGDLLDYLALDAQTNAILLYVESVSHARKFMSAGRIAARTKPVIVIKAGRGSAGARAATSHSGALAGSDGVYDAAFRRAGMLRVRELRELFDAAATLASGVRVRGERLTILTNGGGLGVLAADALEERGGKLADLSAETTARLNAILPPTWSRANPIDILGDAPGSRYLDALNALISQPDQDAILVMNCPTGVASNVDAADAVIRVRSETRGRQTPLLGCWMGEATAEVPRRKLSEDGLPNYETPDEAVSAFMQLVEYRRNQDALLQTPTAGSALGDQPARIAREIIALVIAEGRSVLTEPEAKALLAAYGIPVVETRTAKSPDLASIACKGMRGPFVVKILSRDISHKSDVGGVKLDLPHEGAVLAAAREMLETVAAKLPQATIDGFTVQPMILRPGAHELIVGVSDDPMFGPAILFGQGGVAVEVLRDSAMGLPPLNSALADDLISRTRISKLLAGYRNKPPADASAIRRVLLAVSEMVIDCPEIKELDVNPLLADSDGVVALDARVVVRAFTGDRSARLAIRPYPRELEENFVVSGDATIHVRPIRPEDETALSEMVHLSNPEDLRLRFHGAVKTFTHSVAARLSQIDYDREMAFVATTGDGGGPFVGVARLVFDPNYEAAEFAIIVRSDWQGRGVGWQLMRKLVSYATARGACRLWGDILPENVNMIDFARTSGARCLSMAHLGVVRAEFDLRSAQNEPLT